MRRIKETVRIQNKLNKRIDLNWLNNRTELDFILAIFEESVELAGSYGWKWWRKDPENDFNKKVELIDIYHFVISLELLSVYKSSVNTKSDKVPSFNKILEFTTNIIWNAYRDYLADSMPFVVKCQLEAMSDKDLILKFTSKVINKEYYFPYFFELVNRHFKDLDEFVKWYFIKNILNEIRQDKGYKEGKYQKHIKGREDNELFYKEAVDINFNGSFEDFKQEVLKAYERRSFEGAV